jgi:hypothetical protein
MKINTIIKLKNNIVTDIKNIIKNHIPKKKIIKNDETFIKKDNENKLKCNKKEYIFR